MNLIHKGILIFEVTKNIIFMLSNYIYGMKKLTTLIVLFLHFLLITSYAQGLQKPYVLLISFDGFRYDYVEKYDAKHFKAFIKNGTAADGLITSFPSKTFPNHYSIITGMYPGNHGLVGNSFYDAEWDTTYSMGNRALVESEHFYGGTPLWQLAQEQGLISASYFWVGSEAPVKGQFPNYYYKYDGSVPNEDRIKQVFDWFQLPLEERPDFISLYFSLIDDAGHRYGPDSEKTGKAIQEADRLLGKIMNGLKSIDLPINVIVTSDHGMYELRNDPKKVIFLDNLLPKLSETSRVQNGSYYCRIYESDPQKVEHITSFIKQRVKNSQVYKKENFPKKWNYQNSPRTGDILILAEPGYILQFKESYKKRLTERPYLKVRGVHGYDPYTCTEMQGIFYAQGPNIKKGLKIKAFDNVHIYPLVAKILGLKVPNDIDGKFKVLKKVYMH